MSLQPIAVSFDRCEYQAEQGVRLIFDNITQTTRGLEAWCVVRQTENGSQAPRSLTQARMDLMGSRTVSTLTGEALNTAPSLDKAMLRSDVQEAVADAVNYTLMGPPLRVLADAAPEPRRWTLRPLLEAHSATRLIAPGGSFKSIFALTVAITVATGSQKLLGLKPDIEGPVLYLDWEADAEIHNERMIALCRGAGLSVPRNIFYQQPLGSLYRAARALHASVNQFLPVLVIIDSTAMARGVSGEGASEDSTIRLFSALRTLNRPALLIDHKSDEKIRRRQAGGYGSIFNQNLARLEWEARPMRTEKGIDIALRLEKANNIRPGLELGFRFELTSDDQSRLLTATVAPIDPSTVTAMDDRSSHGDQIAHLLSTQTEAKPVTFIAAALRLTAVQIRKALNQEPSRFENVGSATGGGGKGGLWRVYGAETDEGVYPPLPDNII